MSLTEKACKIKYIVLDIDGVLTNGQIGYSETKNEIKFFDVKDGLGLKFAKMNGIKVGILSGRKSLANRTRIDELKLDFAYEGRKNKEVGFNELLQDYNAKPEECLYIGDDIIDIPALKMAGIGLAVNDAVDEILPYCEFKLNKKGGNGAVREAVEWLLKEQGKWNKTIENFLEN